MAQIITGKLVGVDTDRLGHVGRHRGKMSVPFDEGVACGILQGAGDVDENFLALFNLEIFDCVVLFQVGLTPKRRGDSDRAH